MTEDDGWFFLSEACDKLGRHGKCKEIGCKCGCHPNASSPPANPALKVDYEKEDEEPDDDE